MEAGHCLNDIRTRRFVLGVERERKSCSRFLKLTKLMELETDSGKEFHSQF